MDNIREKLIELEREATDHASDICIDHRDCEDCPGRKYGTHCRDYLKADYFISNGVTVQKWIPVSDRLPSKEEYTAKAEDGTEYYVRFLIAYKTDIVEYEIGYYDGYKWMTEMPIRLIKDVVAWMPFPNMPQPPKGE